MKSRTSGKPLVMLSVLLLAGLLFSWDASADITTLYTFRNGCDGTMCWPWEPAKGPLAQDDSRLYGMTMEGGAGYKGTVYSVKKDGSDLTILHSFGEFPYDGEQYQYLLSGGVILSGTTLFGVTEIGGIYGYGTIFRIETDGSGYAILHSFDGNDGASPCASLALSGDTLYGFAHVGGIESTPGFGTIFRIDTDGTDFTVLHNFRDPSIQGDGSFPHGTPLVSGSQLYGTTYAGGSRKKGTIFRMNTDGTGYSILHSFGDGTIEYDGIFPTSSLILSPKLSDWIKLKS